MISLVLVLAAIATVWSLWWVLALLRSWGVQPCRWQLPLASPILSAHRGGSHLYPENTLEAFQGTARDHGVRLMELDVRTTADGVPVVIHDETVDRTTDGTGAVNALTLGELQAVDAGHGFAPLEGAPNPWTGRGVRIPTLEAVLRALPECWFSVDIKQSQPSCESAVAEVIRACGMTGRVLLGAESWRVFRRIHAEAPEMPSFFSQRGVAGFYLAAHLGLLRWYRPPHHTLQLPERFGLLPLVTPRLVRAARRAGLPLLVWTVNEPEDMRRLLAMGVDGLITDRPDLFNEINAGSGS